MDAIEPDMDVITAAAPTRGLLRLTGADRVAFVHNMTTADVKGLAPGQGTPAVIVNQRAQILDWVGVHAEADALWVTTGPGRTADVLAWLDRYLITEDVAIADMSAERPLTFVTGADAEAALGVAPWTVARRGEALVLGAPGYGGPGYLIAGGPVPAGVAVAAPAELERRRVAAGVPAVGAELTEKTNPWEARLDGSISLAKGCYLGQEVVARLHAYDKVQRLLVGLDLQAGAAIAPGAALVADGKPVGEVTSVAGTQALALLKRAFVAPGGHVMVATPAGAEIGAMISDRPFWLHGAGERPPA